MELSVQSTDRNGNPIETLTNPDTIKELQDFLTEVYYGEKVKEVGKAKKTAVNHRIAEIDIKIIMK